MGVISPGFLAGLPRRRVSGEAMLKRRLADAGLSRIITPHSFRAMVVTDLLQQGVPMEDIQYLVGHSHPSTTQIYDRRARKVTRNIVERISISARAVPGKDPSPPPPATVTQPTGRQTGPGPA